MCGSPKAPAPPPVVPEAPVTPSSTQQSASFNDEKRRRAAAGKTSRSTILTSPRGVSDSASTTQKTLLGA